MPQFNLYLGDCLERMKEIPDGSVDAIITDPPYGVMDTDGGRRIGINGWDESIDHVEMLVECNRILRCNGALILFSQEPYTSKLITETHGNIPFSQRATWIKDTFANHLGCKKALVSYTEDICVFRCKKDIAPNHDFEGFHPLRPYAKQVCDFIGKNKKDIFQEMGHQGMCHFMRHNSTQFSLCTAKTYQELIELYHIDTMPGFVEFEEMKKADGEFKASRQEEREAYLQKIATDFPVVFNLPEGKKYKSNVLEYKKDYSGHHPTQKPVKLMEDLIETYTRPGDVVLDFTMGSGSTGVAAVNTGREFIGIERDEGYFDIAKARIEHASK